MSDSKSTKENRSERGAILALVAFLLIALIGLAAFAIDINHLYVVKNELQNAADAGALAGAAVLYADPDGAGPLLPGSKVNTGANQVAYDTAVANFSDKTAVDVHWTSGNGGDVQRGHWSFATRTFTPNGSENATDLWLKSDEELDADINFINAVQVVARRHDTPALSFFAKIFGHDNFLMRADAVAYLGFSGSLGPGEADQPIVICEQSLLNDDDEYTCNVGRMINSSDDGITTNTAAWTDMEVAEDSCSGTNTSDVAPKICQPDGANTTEIFNGDQLNSTNGMVDALFADLETCWLNATDDDADNIPDHPYRMNLPVVTCGDHATGNCPTVVGAVTVNLMLMTGTNTNKPEDVVPVTMTDADWEAEFNWSAATGCGDYDALAGLTQLLALPQLPQTQLPDGTWTTDRWKIDDRWSGSSSTKEYEQAMANWDCFVDHYNMVNTDGYMAPLANKSLYFMPDCTPHEPAGKTGGSNFGVLARSPVLVE